MQLKPALRAAFGEVRTVLWKTEALNMRSRFNALLFEVEPSIVRDLVDAFEEYALTLTCRQGFIGIKPNFCQAVR
jgi:hypothetical protein